MMRSINQIVVVTYLEIYKGEQQNQICGVRGNVCHLWNLEKKHEHEIWWNRKINACLYQVLLSVFTREKDLFKNFRQVDYRVTISLINLMKIRRDTYLSKRIVNNVNTRWMWTSSGKMTLNIPEEHGKNTKSNLIIHNHITYQQKIGSVTVTKSVEYVSSVAESEQLILK